MESIPAPLKTARHCQLDFGPKSASSIHLIEDGDFVVLEIDGRSERHPLRGDKDNATWREAWFGNVPRSVDSVDFGELTYLSTAGVSTLILCRDAWGIRDCRQVVDNLPLVPGSLDAPVVRFNGPLTFLISFEKRGSDVALVAQVGTAGATPGVFACISSSLAGHILARPIAELCFNRKDAQPCSVNLDLGFDC